MVIWVVLGVVGALAIFSGFFIGKTRGGRQARGAKTASSSSAPTPAFEVEVQSMPTPSSSFASPPPGHRVRQLPASDNRAATVGRVRQGQQLPAPARLPAPRSISFPLAGPHGSSLPEPAAATTPSSAAAISHARTRSARPNMAATLEESESESGSEEPPKMASAVAQSAAAERETSPASPRARLFTPVRRANSRCGSGSGMGISPTPTEAAPPPPTDWVYLDLDSKVQGPFSDEQLAQWYLAGLLHEELPMRPANAPPESWTPLSVLVSQGFGEPCFVSISRARSEYEASESRTPGAQAAAQGGDADLSWAQIITGYSSPGAQTAQQNASDQSWPNFVFGMLSGGGSTQRQARRV